MPKSTVTFISGFLIPNLDEERFGENLKWLDREANIFQIEWMHKGGPRWTEREAEVFAEWDKKKGHYQPADQMYYPKSKQRFRSLLYKLTKQGYLVKLKSDEKFKKVYRIVHQKKTKRKSSTFCNSSESELSNEGYDRNEVDNLNEGYRRMISDDEITNILEDHPYSCTMSSDSEKEQGTDYLYVEIQAAASLYNSLKRSGKKVLTLRNYPYENLGYGPAVNTDENYIQNALAGLKYEEQVTLEAPVLHIPEFFCANNLNISTPITNKQLDDCWFQYLGSGTALTTNENITDFSEALQCSPYFGDLDVPLSKLHEMY